jgi:hypothetical protein
LHLPGSIDTNPYDSPADLEIGPGPVGREAELLADLNRRSQKEAYACPWDHHWELDLHLVVEHLRGFGG